jgi:hypothetical protein
MANPFKDQAKFMRACDQSVGSLNQEQYKLYLDLMEEEWKELQVALDSGSCRTARRTARLYCCYYWRSPLRRL